MWLISITLSKLNARCTRSVCFSGRPRNCPTIVNNVLQIGCGLGICISLRPTIVMPPHIIKICSMLLCALINFVTMYCLSCLFFFSLSRETKPVRLWNRNELRLWCVDADIYENSIVQIGTLLRYNVWGRKKTFAPDDMSSIVVGVAIATLIEAHVKYSLHTAGGWL